MGRYFSLFRLKLNSFAALVFILSIDAFSNTVTPGVSPYSAGLTPPPAQPAGASQQSPGGAQKPSIVVPTPDTIPPPDLKGGGGTSSLPAASEVKSPTSYGRFRSPDGTVKVADMILDQYQHSVVRITVRDQAGNGLGKAMGVAIGRTGQYIATPLSLILGNTQQWADKIEVTHAEGNSYYANIAFVDEERNLVLLSPETKPAPIAFCNEFDERPQVTVYAIKFSDTLEKQADGSTRKIKPIVFTEKLSAANTENGLLSVSTAKITDDMAGTALINAQGQLVGMLLPKGRGVLSSALQSTIAKVKGTKPIEPTFLGVLLGRGVLVDQKSPEAYKTINEAIEAIRKGDAPKVDKSRFLPATKKDVAPSASDKVVIKVQPGVYKEKGPINIPSNISLSGSGPATTILQGSSVDKPVLYFQNAENSMISGFRITPPPLQKLQAPAVIVTKSTKIAVLGNLIEAKGGVGLWLHESKRVSVNGNSFPRGESRGFSCTKSDVIIEGNSFLGDWPMAISIDHQCNAQVTRNLFYENKSGIFISKFIDRARILRNSFIRNTNGIRINGGKLDIAVNDNLFFENNYGLYSLESFDYRQKVGRNAVWKSRFEVSRKQVSGTEFVRTEPAFENPDSFDFRIKSGYSQLGGESGVDLGAYQREDFLGTYTQQFVHTLGVSSGNEKIREEWGIRNF